MSHKALTQYDGLALFSGGLDSILAARTIQEQGLKVKCLHFTSPFFGYPEKVKHWEEVYNLEIESVDIGEAYSNMLRDTPTYGFGSTLNPCVDCKILMMKKSRELLDYYSARFIISGEVLGQRPMSQRRDTLNVIRRDADIKDMLLRPLCALHMEETQVEKEGLVKRELLHNFSGRGRQSQLKLAEKFGIREIPTPAGGCKLTEKESSARYWYVLNKYEANADNFSLANIGRQLWHSENNQWLVVGRNKEDNEKMESLTKDNDITMRIHGFPSPLALMRPKSESIHKENIIQAASTLASYSPKAVAHAKEGNKIEILVFEKDEKTIIEVTPNRSTCFTEPTWENAKSELKAKVKQEHTD